MNTSTSNSGYGLAAVSFANNVAEGVRQVKTFEQYGYGAQVVDGLAKRGAAKFASNVGKGFIGVSVGVALVQFGTSDQSGEDIARLTGAGIILGTAFIPVVGPAISIGLGVADSFGAFDGIYESFDP